MLRKLLVLGIVLAALAAEQATAQITFSVNVTGTMSTPDRRTAERMIDKENARRAALTPPLPALTYADAATRKASYETTLAHILTQAHASYMTQTDEVTNEQRRKGYKAAPTNVQDQVDALLQPYIPAPGAFILPIEWERLRRELVRTQRESA